jgi:hypothetical protein
MKPATPVMAQVYRLIFPCSFLDRDYYHPVKTISFMSVLQATPEDVVRIIL